MDRVINLIVGMGVPGIILLIAIAATGLSGAAAITAALAALGPGGMVGGIGVLAVSGLISWALSEYGFEEIYKRVLRKMKEDKGLSERDIVEKIERAKISRGMKLKIIDYITNIDPLERKI